ncbi:hypothetical protein [Streptomyces sp. 6N223]|uniref:hypothetical protein n=1 Tax=Streptomyces sp. 6N223 TaxID=3457412 RepID=UPI003FD5B6D4
MTAIKRADAPVAFSTEEGVELRRAEIGGDMSVAYIRLPKGTDMAPPLKGLPDDMCQSQHWGVINKGRVLLRTPHGSETYEPGDAFYWEPGHAPEALEDTEFMDFSPTKEFDKTIDHVKAQLG